MDSPESRTREATAGISGGEDTENREKLADRGSNRDHRCGDCYGHSAEIADGVEREASILRFRGFSFARGG